MDAEDLIARLDAVRTTGLGRWPARCPAHDDRHPPLRSERCRMDAGSCIALQAARSIPWCRRSGYGCRTCFLPRSSDQPTDRRPWPTEDVLRAMAHEALIAAIAIENVGRGEALSTADRDRALLAAERLRDAAVLGVV